MTTTNNSYWQYKVRTRARSLPGGYHCADHKGRSRRAVPFCGCRITHPRHCGVILRMVEQVWYLPRDGYISMPWRNGAGVTHEIMRVPAQGEPFSWRLSLATVASNGPFSAYPGYQRAVALVDGAGFRLDIKNARAQELRARGANGCLLYTSPSPRDRQKSR